MLHNNQTELVNAIKLLIYKENMSLLENLNFDDDNVFLEPLLFAYFNYKGKNHFPEQLLSEFMQGYLIEKKDLEINFCFNTSGVAYIPKLGYFKKGELSPFEPIHKIEDTDIEVLKYSVILFKDFFRNSSMDLIREEDIEFGTFLFDKNIGFLTNAFNFIKKYSGRHFDMIQQCCKKIVLFKTDASNLNSFATIKAQGIAFFNVYQEDYDEVFFVDDIAHQTGHIILTTLFHNRKSIFKIDEEQYVVDILKIKDHRTVYILMHALYTYYTTLLCMNDCLINNAFDLKQSKEALGRIGFYLNKCSSDLDKFEKINTLHNGIENVLTLKGIEIYTLIREKYLETSQKWKSTTMHYNYTNQNYNFAFKKFNLLN